MSEQFESAKQQETVDVGRDVVGEHRHRWVRQSGPGLHFERYVMPLIEEVGRRRCGKLVDHRPRRRYVIGEQVSDAVA